MYKSAREPVVAIVACLSGPTQAPASLPAPVPRAWVADPPRTMSLPLTMTTSADSRRMKLPWKCRRIPTASCSPLPHSQIIYACARTTASPAPRCTVSEHLGTSCGDLGSESPFVIDEGRKYCDCSWSSFLGTSRSAHSLSRGERAWPFTPTDDDTEMIVRPADIQRKPPPATTSDCFGSGVVSVSELSLVGSAPQGPPTVVCPPFGGTPPCQ